METSLFFTIPLTSGGQAALNKKYIVSITERAFAMGVEVKTINGDTYLTSMPFLSIWQEVGLLEHRSEKG